MYGAMNEDDEGGSCWSFFMDLLKTSLIDDTWGVGYGLEVWADSRGDSSHLGHPAPDRPDIVDQGDRRKRKEQAIEMF